MCVQSTFALTLPLNIEEVRVLRVVARLAPREPDALEDALVRAGTQQGCSPRVPAVQMADGTAANLNHPAQIAYLRYTQSIGRGTLAVRHKLGAQTDPLVLLPERRGIDPPRPRRRPSAAAVLALGAAHALDLDVGLRPAKGSPHALIHHRPADSDDASVGGVAERPAPADALYLPLDLASHVGHRPPEERVPRPRANELERAAGAEEPTRRQHSQADTAWWCVIGDV